MRNATRIAAGALALLLVAGCGTTTQDTKTDSGTATTPASAATTEVKPQELSFLFPVSASGDQAKLIQAMVDEYNSTNTAKNKVTATFAGNYGQTMDKVQTLIKGGQAPDVAVLLSTDLFSLLDQSEVIALDDYINADKDGKEYIGDFWPAFMENSQTGGKTYGIPFQRSAVVMYYNKDMFAKAGFDHAPKDWQELVKMGKALTQKGADGKVSVWGYEVPTKGLTYWELQPEFLQNGKNVTDETGAQVFYNDPKVVDALQTFINWGEKDGFMPAKSLVDWMAAPSDFQGGKAAMIMHSTGSYVGIKGKANFKVGVAALPAGPAGFGSPTGGGNLYVFKTTPERQKAAWDFVRFMTTTDRAAKWSIDTGYIAARKSAYETPAYKNLITKDANYGAIRDQIQYLHRELATHQNAQVSQALNDALQAAILGQKSAKDALDGAQKTAEGILAPWKK